MKHIKRLVWCIVCMSVSVWQLSAQEKKVSQWERFEVVLHGSAEGNPFSDVSLYADFWQQEGDTVSVQGFYDGDGRYIIRFMPWLCRECGIMPRKAISPLLQERKEI